MENKPDLTGLNVMGVTVKPTERRKAWLADEDGHHGVIEYDGEEFYYREASRQKLRRFARETQRLDLAGKRLAQQQAQEIRNLQESKKRELVKQVGEQSGQKVGADTLLETGLTIEQTAAQETLSDERQDYYDDKTEEILNDAEELYNDLLTSCIVGWSLERKFDPALLSGFSKKDKLTLCEAVASISVTGSDSTKN